MTDILQSQTSITRSSTGDVPKAPISTSPTLSSVARRSSTSRHPKSPDLLQKPAIRLISTFTTSSSNGRTSLSEHRKDAPLDPLSNIILARTNLAVAPSRMRSSVPSEQGSTIPDSTSPPTSTLPSTRPSLDGSTSRQDNLPTLTKEKAKKGSFFSRFVGPKKRNEAIAEVQGRESDADDKASSSYNVAMFSQQGYIPEFPLPPKYVRTKTFAKRGKDFGRMFLAQELRGRTGLEIAQEGGRSAKSATASNLPIRKESDAVWAMEFSKDGKYLAAGGHDFLVRIWIVLGSKEERQTQEADRAKEKLSKKDEASSIPRLYAPVFKNRTVREFPGHSGSVLDLSWSKNNFLLSSSMDKTVRLWHVSREECLCCFKHSDFVTSIQFHPRDDRFFLAGSLDSKLRLWSIPDKSVAYSQNLPDLITAVAFSPDGKTATAGCLNGLCLFYDTEGLEYSGQIHVRSAHGKNAKGSKITGIQMLTYPPDDPNGEVKMLLTSNDSRVRVYNMRDKGLDLKLKGNENSSSQIHATFSDDAAYIICGSEDRKAYIWSTAPSETDKDKRPMECFETSTAIVTAAIMAPNKTHLILSQSSDPVYDLCNPPPVTLVSRNYSTSSIAATEDDAPVVAPPPRTDTGKSSLSKPPQESPAYQARCAHKSGRIVVTADFNGNIKVYRQDCAQANRTKHNESSLNKRLMSRGGSINGVTSRTSKRSSRTSLTLHSQSSDRILSWRQSVNNTNNTNNNNSSNGHAHGEGSLDNNSSPAQRHGSRGQLRNASPSKYFSAHSSPIAGAGVRHGSQSSISNSHPVTSQTPPLSSRVRSSPLNATGLAMRMKDASSKSAIAQAPPTYLVMPDNRPTTTDEYNDSDNPLMLQGDQSYMFWNRQTYQDQVASMASTAKSRVGDQSDDKSASVTPANTSLQIPGQQSGSSSPKRLSRQITAASRLSMEEFHSAASSGSITGANDDEDDDAEEKCGKCGCDSFRIRKSTVETQKVLVCRRCGSPV